MHPGSPWRKGMAVMPDDILIGRQFKEFILQEQIGRGGMARVYRAYQPSVKRDVAIKVIDFRGDTSDERFRERFAREAELIAHLEHIHILPVYDYGIVNEMAFLVMRLLTGGSLRDLLQDHTMDTDRAVDLFKQFASALSYAHSKGVIHRDLKPANIMLDDAGNALVTDFGLARLIEASQELTETDRIVGTPHFMSPEQLRGDPLTPRSDIYSLGVVLYRMLVGQLPFAHTSGDLISSIYQNIEKAPPAPREINPEISIAVEDVILRALEKKPADRFVSADEMAEALSVAVGRVSSSSRRPVHPSATTLNAFKIPVPTKRLYFTLIPVLMIAVMVGAFFLLKARAEPENRTPTVLSGETMVAADIIPAEDEISRADEALGERGFVAMIACNQTSEYHATIAREVKDFAEEYGLPVTVYDSNSDSYVQQTMIERARSEGAVAMIICSLDHDLIAPSLRSAQAAGIRLVFLHADIPSYGGVRLAGDNFQMGFKPGSYAGEIIRDELDGRAEVITLDYPELDDIVLRANGLETGMLENAPDAHVIGRYLGGTTEFAQESVQTLLDSGVTFDVILSINDAGAYGAIKALENAGYSGDEVMIFSVDAELLARQYIEDGYFMRASVEIGRTRAAQTAVDAMVKLLSGGTIAEDIRTEPGLLFTREILRIPEE